MRCGNAAYHALINLMYLELLKDIYRKFYDI